LEAWRVALLVPTAVKFTWNAPFVQTVLPLIPGVAAVFPVGHVTVIVPVPLPVSLTGALAMAAPVVVPLGRSLASTPLAAA
jgi:hypothetical protein